VGYALQAGHFIFFSSSDDRSLLRIFDGIPKWRGVFVKREYTSTIDLPLTSTD